MDPNQTPNPNQPGAVPPQLQPYPGATSPQPYQAPVQQTPAIPPNQPATPASWYAPPVDPNANRPADASSYIQAAGIPPQQPGTQPTANVVPGQMVNGQYTVDHLSQIAPVTTAGSTGSTFLNKKFIFLGIGLAVALLAAAAILFMQPKTATSNKPVLLYTTLVDIEKTTATSGKLLKSSKLSSINSSTRTHLHNAIRDMEAPLTNAGQQPSKLKSSATKEPYHDKKFLETLDDARLNAKYDRTYASEMDIKLQAIVNTMESVGKTTKSKSMKEFVDKNIDNFKTSQKSITEWRTSDEAKRY